MLINKKELNELNFQDSQRLCVRWLIFLYEIIGSGIWSFWICYTTDKKAHTGTSSNTGTGNRTVNGTGVDPGTGTATDTSKDSGNGTGSATDTGTRTDTPTFLWCVFVWSTVPHIFNVAVTAGLTRSSSLEYGSSREGHFSVRYFSLSSTFTTDSASSKLPATTSIQLCGRYAAD